MNVFGYSTGALALSDYETALKWLVERDIRGVELSALRMSELEPLATHVHTLDLSSFEYISVHAPSRFSSTEEIAVARLCLQFVERGWPVVVHPDTIHNPERWHAFGNSLLIENMDKRKLGGRNADELARIFEKIPEAGMCFDIAHARQYDGTMTEAYRILSRFGPRVTEIHVSEVTSRSAHDRVSPLAARAFQSISTLLPSVPVIIESRISREDIPAELDRVRHALAPEPTPMLLA
jgi:sugar phosphate isomerase/epimerase